MHRTEKGTFTPTMNHYFHLQKTIIERHLRAWRIHPWLAYALGALLFFGIGFLVYARTYYAGFGVLAVGVVALSWLGNSERNDFLDITFQRPVYRKIRLLENGIFALPFVILLLLKGDWALALVQCLLGGAMSLLRMNASPAYTLPTPFGAYPFEAAIGFRRFWWLVAGAVFLLVMGARADNMELAIFSYGGLMLVYLMFYQDPEPSFYVWVHANDPHSFLKRKLKIALGYQLLIGLPFLLVIYYFFPEVGWALLIGPVIAALNLVLIIFMKYSNFPHPLNIMHSFALLAGLVLWPLLLFLLPYYYRRALPLLEANLPGEDQPLATKTANPS
jgi:hypothetical protein